MGVKHSVFDCGWARRRRDVKQHQRQNEQHSNSAQRRRPAAAAGALHLTSACVLFNCLQFYTIESALSSHLSDCTMRGKQFVLTVTQSMKIYWHGAVSWRRRSNLCWPTALTGHCRHCLYFEESFCRNCVFVHLHTFPAIMGSDHSRSISEERFIRRVFGIEIFVFSGNDYITAGT